MVLLIPRRIKELKDQGKKEGKREGRKEAHRKWLAWNERRINAEREGRPFNESPPTLPQEQDDE